MIDRIDAAFFAHPQGMHNSAGKQIRIVDCRQGDYRDAIRKIFRERRGDCKDDARFPNAARTRQRDQPHIGLAQSGASGGDLGVTPDQGCWEQRRLGGTGVESG